MEPTSFGPVGAELSGWYHPVADGRTGVVLCPPLGDEALQSHRAYRFLAEAFASAGLPSLRFDYHGTGDSSGADADPDRLVAWVQSVQHAVAELRRVSGVEQVNLLGVRMGATLAALAAAEMGGVPGLVLWGACATGSGYLRELRALRQIGGAASDTIATLAGQDGEESGGFLLTRSTIEAMGKVDLGALPCAPAERALVLARDDFPAGEQRLAHLLTKAGCRVDVERPAGYAAMMCEPHNARLPVEVAQAVVAWLGGDLPSVSITPRPPRRSSAARGLSVPASTGWPTALREEPVVLSPDGRVFGILARRDLPELSDLSDLDGSEPPPDAVIFLNAGGVSHIGPNRMYVAMARRLAGLGFLTLRIDVSGLGDAAWTERVSDRMYARDAVGDAQLAIEYLRNAHASRRVYLVGLCSGAYVAFYTALAGPGVAGQVLINPQTFAFRPGDSLDVRVLGPRQLVRMRNWRSLLRGQLHVGDFREAVHRQLGLARTRATALLRLPARAGAVDLAASFGTVLDRGTETLLVYSRHDPGLEYLRAHLGSRLRRLLARPDLRLEIVHGPDHTFTPLWSQSYLSDLVVEYLTTCSARKPPAPPGKLESQLTQAA